jgi:2,4-dichlorophenol 6-monooxygenase
VPVDAVRIGHVDGDFFDPRCMWLRQREIAADGAVLVRPDRFIGWRSLTCADEPLAELSAALETILAQRIRTRA